MKMLLHLLEVVVLLGLLWEEVEGRLFLLVEEEVVHLCLQPVVGEDLL